MDVEKAKVLQQQIKRLEDEIMAEEVYSYCWSWSWEISWWAWAKCEIGNWPADFQARHKSTRGDLELTQVELSREKIKNVDLQNSVATALGSESSAVKRAGESLAALSDARLAVKAKDAERETLISTASLNRKKLVAKFVSLVESGGQLKEFDERMIGKKQQKFRSSSSELFYRIFRFRERQKADSYFDWLFRNEQGICWCWMQLSEGNDSKSVDRRRWAIVAK